MTRHGTLAYYLAAWIVGCPAVAACFWAIASVRAGELSFSQLFVLCFFALIFGAADSLIFAVLLRRLMYWTGARKVAVWALAGAVLSLALIFVFALDRYTLFDTTHGAASFVNAILFIGADAIWKAGWWQAPIEGAGLAAVLCLIDRALNRSGEDEISTRVDDGKTARAGQSPA